MAWKRSTVRSRYGPPKNLPTFGRFFDADVNEAEVRAELERVEVHPRPLE